jgi:hypothetical protein
MPSGGSALSQRFLCRPGSQSHRGFRNSLDVCLEVAEDSRTACSGLGRMTRRSCGLGIRLTNPVRCIGDGELLGGFHEPARTTSRHRVLFRAGLADADVRESPPRWAISVERSAYGAPNSSGFGPGQPGTLVFPGTCCHRLANRAAGRT